MDPTDLRTTALDSATLAMLAHLIGEAVSKGVGELAERTAITPLKPLLVNIKGVRALTGLSKASVYRLFPQGAFPPPVEGPAGTMWRVADIERWVAKLKQK